jgi:hypothetical protein
MTFGSSDSCRHQNTLFQCHPVGTVTVVCLSRFRCIGFMTASAVGGASLPPPPHSQHTTARVWPVAESEQQFRFRGISCLSSSAQEPKKLRPYYACFCSCITDATALMIGTNSPRPDTYVIYNPITNPRVHHGIATDTDY